MFKNIIIFNMNIVFFGASVTQSNKIKKSAFKICVHINMSHIFEALIFFYHLENELSYI